MENKVQYIGSFVKGYWHGLGCLKDQNNRVNHGEFFNDRLIGI